VFSLLIDLFKDTIVLVRPIIRERTGARPQTIAPSWWGRWYRFDNHLDRLTGWNPRVISELDRPTVYDTVQDFTCHIISPIQAC
jgi:hypothetical protein